MVVDDVVQIDVAARGRSTGSACPGAHHVSCSRLRRVPTEDPPPSTVGNLAELLDFDMDQVVGCWAYVAVRARDEVLIRPRWPDRSTSVGQP